MDPAAYDAWYDTPRGHWIGETEFRLAARLLAAHPGESLLDVGCGTGWFSRRFAEDGLQVTGLDSDPEWLDYARARGDPAIHWLEGDAQALPLADSSFDHVVSIAALCFMADEQKAVAEIVRVARRSFVIGWLNRASLLYWQKGRHGGSGAYRGARWHTAQEVLALFAGTSTRNLTIRSAIFLPSATRWAALLEQGLPNALNWGGMLLLHGEKA
jgi:SAM-dependent methyltransferase